MESINFNEMRVPQLKNYIRDREPLTMFKNLKKPELVALCESIQREEFLLFEGKKRKEEEELKYKEEHPHICPKKDCGSLHNREELYECLIGGDNAPSSKKDILIMLIKFLMEDAMIKNKKMEKIEEEIAEVKDEIKTVSEDLGDVQKHLERESDRRYYGE